MSGGKMSDARERLVARQRDEYGASWDVLVPEVGWTLGRIIESVIEDALAEFEVTPRGVHNHDIDPACPETRLPDGSLRGECITNAPPPTVKPSVEDVARAIDPAIYPHINHLTGDAWAASKRAATAVLALLPGRSEAEVKREAAEKAWDEGEECAPDCEECAACDKAGDLGHLMCGRCEHGEPRHHGEHFRCAAMHQSGREGEGA